MKHSPSLIGEASFADLINQIEQKRPALGPKASQWTCSLKQMAAYLGRPSETLPARAGAIAQQVRNLHPERLGVSPKTFANHRANVKAALKWGLKLGVNDARGVPLSDAWQVLFKCLPDDRTRSHLSPFLKFLSGLGVEPEAVSDSHVEAFALYRTHTHFDAFTNSRRRSLVRAWNAMVATVKGWPEEYLLEPAAGMRSKGPVLSEFPDTLIASIENYLKSMRRPHLGSNGKRYRGWSERTVELNRRRLYAMVRVAVQEGIELAELKSLAVLCHPDLAERILEAYWRRDGELPKIYTIDLSFFLVSIAASLACLSKDDMERLKEMRARLDECRPPKMTQKNIDLIRKVLGSNIWSDVAKLPQRLIAEAHSNLRCSPVKAAVTAQMAIAIRLLTVAPVRMANQCSIQLDYHLIQPNGPNAPYWLVFPAQEVKNGVPMEFPLTPETSNLIKDYIHTFRPLLMRGMNHDYLYPGERGPLKAQKTLADQIALRIWNMVGLKITPHQFRHAAGAIILRKEPGNYEMVRRILGHKNIQTTINFYVGLETTEATRQFGRLIESGLKSEKDTGTGRWKRSRGWR